MQKVSIEMENCYGIGKLSCEFDFSHGRVHSVYAPNGFMKTSFAKALRDVSDKKNSSDLMFPERPTRRDVRDEAGVELAADQVLVIPPYEDAFPAERTSLLLVDAALKQRYDEAIALVVKVKADFLKALKDRSGLKSRTDTPEAELQRWFGGHDLYDILGELEQEAARGDHALANIDYTIVFGEKASAFLGGSGALAQITAYVEQFDTLVSESPILTKQFTHTQAAALQKSLVGTSFFGAKHWVTFRDGAGTTEVRDADQFRARVEVEMQRVLADTRLRQAFEDIDKKLAANADLQQLREYLRVRPELLPRLSNYAAFRKEVWAAYLAAEAALLGALVSQHAASRGVMEQVVHQAQNQSTDWAAVVDQFNARFSVPFRLAVENQADVILKKVAPRLNFAFTDSDGNAPVASRDVLLPVLSQGERRALYLLNVLFEIRIRQAVGRPTLVVVDDIADSFDYRNKYAIIEYLQDVCRAPNFLLIVLTHNYDFHRSAAGRLNVRRECRHLAVRAGREVKLVPEKYQNSPLTHWQQHPEDPRKFIASVPFVRNLAEYCAFDDVFGVLTDVLHLKSSTKSLTLADIDREYAKVINNYRAPVAPARTTVVWDLIVDTAVAIQAEGAEHAELEAKIVLSIAIRLRAEEHMIAAISDPTFVSNISKDQTHRLLAEYRRRFPGAVHELSVLGQVQLMTPENIHLNSFMYEPILDLGIGQLKQLYSDVRALS